MLGAGGHTTLASLLAMFPYFMTKNYTKKIIKFVSPLRFP